MEKNNFLQKPFVFLGGGEERFYPNHMTPRASCLCVMAEPIIASLLTCPQALKKMLPSLPEMVRHWE